MYLLFTSLAIVAIAVLTFSINRHRNLRIINEGERIFGLALANLREKGHLELAHLEERKLVDPSYANKLFLNTGKSHALSKGLGSNFATERYAEHVACSLIVKNTK